MQKISGVILAGRGQRMGSVNKGLQLFRGKPMSAWACERLAPQVDELLINANHDIVDYARLGYPVVSDVVTGFAGPLAGLHAALSAAQHPLLATVPCDSPFFPEDLVSRLSTALTTGNTRIAVARTGDQLHPVFCLCHRDALSHLTAYLERGERRFENWFRSLAGAEVCFDDQADALPTSIPAKNLNA